MGANPSAGLFSDAVGFKLRHLITAMGTSGRLCPVRLWLVRCPCDSAGVVLFIARCCYKDGNPLGSNTGGKYVERLLRFLLFLIATI